MSYILDALKKSDQERQQGTSPNLYVTHGPIPQVRGTSRGLKHSKIFWLFCACVILFLSSIGLYSFQYYNFYSAKNSTQKVASQQLVPPQKPPKTTTISQPTIPTVQTQESPPAKILASKDNEIAQPITISEPIPKPNPKTVEVIMASKASTPLLQDLSTDFQAEIPKLNCAGHIYAKNPKQRMIIINGKILREGSMIDNNLHLREITWEGVIIQFKNTLFKIKTNR